MKTATVIDVLAAAHWTYKLTGIPAEFSQRGGIMLVGQPEQLKTQFISMLEDYPRTLILSDLTTRELADFHQDLGIQYKTLGFTAFEKISQRDQNVAANFIGHLTALAEEGFRGSYKSDKRQRTYRARVLLIGAVPQYYYDRNFKDWMSSGFHRRFLWPSFQLADPDIIKHAILKWKPLNLRDGSIGFPIPTDSIPYDVSEKERIDLSECLRANEGMASPLVLLSKIYSVLKWRYNSEIAMAIMLDFSEALKSIANLELGVVPELAALVDVRKFSKQPQKGKQKDGISKRKPRRYGSAQQSERATKLQRRDDPKQGTPRKHRTGGRVSGR